MSRLTINVQIMDKQHKNLNNNIPSWNNQGILTGKI